MVSETDPVDKAMKELSDAMVQGFSVIEGGSPTITPVVDLGEVRKQAKAIQGMFGGINTSNVVATAVVNRQNGTGLDIGKTPATSSGGVTFNQTINSPTQLSPRQIYRSTDSLLNIKKESWRKT